MIKQKLIGIDSWYCPLQLTCSGWHRWITIMDDVHHNCYLWGPLNILIATYNLYDMKGTLTFYRGLLVPVRLPGTDTEK